MKQSNNWKNYKKNMESDQILNLPDLVIKDLLQPIPAMPVILVLLLIPVLLHLEQILLLVYDPISRIVV